MKLMDILFESEFEKALVEIITEAGSNAANKAHELGLVSKGWGRWADPETGEIVAKTVQGNLVKVDPKVAHRMPSDQEHVFNQQNPKSLYQIGQYDTPYDMTKSKDTAHEYQRAHGLDKWRDYTRSPDRDAEAQENPQFAPPSEEPEGLEQQGVEQSLHKSVNWPTYRAFTGRKDGLSSQPRPDLVQGEVPLSGPFPKRDDATTKDMKKARKFDRQQLATRGNPLNPRPRNDPAKNQGYSFDPSSGGSPIAPPEVKKKVSDMILKHGWKHVDDALDKLKSHPNPSIAKQADKYAKGFRAIDHDMYNIFSTEDPEYGHLVMARFKDGA